ncbi:hypothetical protein CB1_000526021 [Camelus ferus]|nr:hypothetical protein CB1_000526021 [Camelus ferus]
MRSKALQRSSTPNVTSRRVEREPGWRCNRLPLPLSGKRYNVVDVSAALCMSLGLIWFTLADSTVAPNFNLTGVMLISLALCADAVIGNVQEKAMKLHNASNSEMNPVRTYGYAFLFSLTGYFGISFVLALIKIFGALLAVTGMYGLVC